MSHRVDDHFRLSGVDYTESNPSPYFSSDSIRDQASLTGELMSTSGDFFNNLGEELPPSYGQVEYASSQGLAAAAITTFGGDEGYEGYDGYDGYDDWYSINDTTQGIGAGIPAKREPPNLDHATGLQGDISMNALSPGSATLSAHRDSTAMKYGQYDVNDSVASSFNST